jgi:integrase
MIMYCDIAITVTRQSPHAKDGYGRRFTTPFSMAEIQPTTTTTPNPSSDIKEAVGKNTKWNGKLLEPPLKERETFPPFLPVTLSNCALSASTRSPTLFQTSVPLEIQRWFKSLNSESKLAWTTIAKMRGVMSRIYKVGILHERVTKNPVLHVETRSKTNYRAIVLTPTQTFNILKSLTNNLHHTLVLTCAATALRSSEILALRWADILWLEERIRVSKRWVRGSEGGW